MIYDDLEYIVSFAIHGAEGSAEQTKVKLGKAISSVSGFVRKHIATRTITFTGTGPNMKEFIDDLQKLMDAHGIEPVPTPETKCGPCAQPDEICEGFGFNCKGGAANGCKCPHRIQMGDE